MGSPTPCYGCSIPSSCIASSRPSEGSATSGTLEPLPGGRHDKVIVITRQGQTLIDDVIEPLMRGERRAFHTLDEAERGQLLSLTDKLVSALRDALESDSS